jgi:hypothetical protein
MTVTDERVDLGVDLDKAVPCEGWRKRCTRPATWRATFRPCGCRFNSCDACKLDDDVYGEPGGKCLGCGVPVAVANWRPL